MKNLKRVTFVIVLVALLLGMATVVNAESAIVVEKTQTTGDTTARDVIFANGTPITITAREDGAAGATIKYEGGSIDVGDTAIIFGGSHSDAISNISETNITMEGGKVGQIFGGNLHVGTVETANIVVNGGTVGFVMGGGAAYMAKIPCTNTANHQVTTATSSDDAKTIVNEANIEFNGGTTTYVYGGGEAQSYTKAANITINGGKVTKTVSGSGSNGFMDTADITVTGGTISELKPVVRGTLGDATISATGGNIGTLSATGDDTNGAVKKVIIDLDGDVVVTTLTDGQNISDLDTDEDGNKDLSVSMIASAVTTNNLSNRDTYQEVKTVTITVAGKAYVVNKGTTVKVLNTDPKDEVITAMKTYIALTGEDLEYVLVDDEGNTYGLEDALVADVELKVAVKEPDAEDPGTTEPLPGDDQPGSDVPGTDEPATTEPEPDNGNGGSTTNPNTGDNVVVYSVAGLVGLAVVAISLVRKNKLSK